MQNGWSHPRRAGFPAARHIKHQPETASTLEEVTVIGDVVELTLGGSPEAGTEDKRYAYK